MSASKKPLIKFEESSKQPFAIFLIGALIVSALVIIITMIAGGLSFTLSKDLIKGDVHADQSLNASDVLEIMLHEYGESEFDGAQADAADVDGNGDINNTDALMISQYAIGVSDRLGSIVPVTQPDTTPVAQAAQITTPAADTGTGDTEDANDTTESEAADSAQQTTPAYAMSGSSSGTTFLTNNELYYTARIRNAWTNENGKNMYQIELRVKNTSDTDVYTAAAAIQLTDSAGVETEHHCSVEKNDNKSLNVTMQDINSIRPGCTFSCDFIISSLTELSIQGLTTPAEEE